VEEVLRGHEGVGEAVVMAREDVAGDRRLVAYIVAEAGLMPTVSELRGHAQERLPDYMVPFSFIMLDDLPLTSNGKIDRRALPAPGNARPELDDIYVAPRTPTEEMLATIWEGVLGIKGIGVYDNFFEMGGHSLMATQLISRVREAFNVELPVKVFFTGDPTIARLADEIEEIRLSQSSDDDIAAMLKDLDELSDEEVKALLESESQSARDTEIA
jgi:acyl carrier protein